MSFSSSSSVKVNAPLARVWAALTEPELVKQYFFGTQLVTDWRVGSPVFFRGEWEGKTYEDRGTVKSFEPLRTLSYDYWSSMSGHEDLPELRSLVRCDLRDTGGGATELTVTQSGLPTQQRADDSAKNWPVVLDGLKKVAEAG
jgi:uncharacterized protein YndB with AHSA1/START domain